MILVAAAFFFVGKVLVDNWPDVRAGWRPPRPAYVAAAGGTLVVSYLYLLKRRKPTWRDMENSC